MKELLEQYAEVKFAAERLATEIRRLENEIASQMLEAGAESAITQYNSQSVRAMWKPGRQSTDHEAAFVAVYDSSERDNDWLLAIKETHTVVKATTSWAKVTKEAKIDTAPFTTQGDPVFVIEIK